MTIDRNTTNWTFETDIAVVGSGGCGLTAAIAAAQGGAEVIVFEKQERPLSNTARSGGMIPAAGTRFQKTAGIEESPQDLAADIFRKNHHASDPELTLHLARTARQMVEWLVDDVGVDLVFIDDFKYPGHSQFRMHAPPSRTGAALVSDLRRAVERQPLTELITDAAAVNLIAGANDEVLGVVVVHGTRVERVRAKKVILACNGFAGNPQMVAHYCPKMANALYFGGEGNTGEGILWGIELGAEVAFMDAFQAHASVATPHGILITYALIMEGGFQVNSQGKRFGNESSGYSEHALDVLAQPGGVAWDIYDRRLHLLGLSFDDYRQAIEAGAIKQADTIEDLAHELRLPPVALAQTLADYERCATGDMVDPFGRPDCRPLEGPFYGAKVTGSLFHTQGGLKVDFDARVLRQDEKPIPNLYAGGGVAAGISGHGAGGYFSGNGLLTAIGYGMLAGRHASQAIKIEVGT
ncbi:MAG TPA: FAD-dependent oxidoreductase [Anaerolineae bacterium]|jgi:fumarate reductase flavoprotein subunit|nr:FAD-dependent oxidoreductase [Anaerolineae bacterium]